MSARRQELRDVLEAYYRDCGFRVQAAADGTLRATGPGGVTFIGLAVVADDLEDAGFEARLLDLAEERMPTGQRCPLELLPEADCTEDLRLLLARHRLERRGHVEVYSLAA